MLEDDLQAFVRVSAGKDDLDGVQEYDVWQQRMKHFTVNPTSLKWLMLDGYGGKDMLRECRTTTLPSWCSLIIRLPQEDLQHTA